MTDANVAALLITGFAIHCITIYALIKILILKKPLTSNKEDTTIGQVDSRVDKLEQEIRDGQGTGHGQEEV